MTFEYVGKKIDWMVSYGALGTGGLLHSILYCVLFRSLHCHEVMAQILGGSVKLGW